MLKEIENISQLCLLTWRYDLQYKLVLPLSQTYFKWFQMCWSPCNSTAFHWKAAIRYITASLVMRIRASESKSKISLKFAPTG